MPVTVTIQRPNLVDGDVLDAAALAAMTAVNVTVAGAVAADEFAAYKTQATNSLNGSISSLVLVPVGSVVPYAGTSVPANWWACEGQLLSRTSYAALFAAIGTSWGAGDGTTTFALPDLRGRTLLGQDTSASRTPNAATIGATAGVSSVALTTAQLPAHTHVVDPAVATTTNSGTHTHSETVPYVPNQSIAGTYDMVMHHVQNDPFNKPSTNTAGWLTGSDYNNWPNELDVSVYGARPMVQAGDHTHTVDIPATATTVTGSGGSHDNMPPFATIRWLIRVR